MFTTKGWNANEADWSWGEGVAGGGNRRLSERSGGMEMEEAEAAEGRGSASPCESCVCMEKERAGVKPLSAAPFAADEKGAMPGVCIARSGGVGGLSADSNTARSTCLSDSYACPEPTAEEAGAGADRAVWKVSVNSCCLLSAAKNMHNRTEIRRQVSAASALTFGHIQNWWVARCVTTANR